VVDREESGFEVAEERSDLMASFVTITVGDRDRLNLMVKARKTAMI